VRPRLLALLPVLLLTLAPLALAQEPEEPEAAEPGRTVRDEITVAERAPEPAEESVAAVTVLTREDLEAAPVLHLGEVLEQVPGMFVLFADDGGMLPQVSARGFFGGGDAEYVQLRVDGVPWSDVESGVAPWERLRAEDVERVEVLRGTGSSLYGDTALAGVVRVVTRHGRAGETGGGAGLTAGVDDLLSGQVFQRFRRGGDGAWTWGLAAAAARSDGYREHGDGDRRSLDLSVTGPWRGDPSSRFGLTVGGETRDREEPGLLTPAELAADRFASSPLFRFDRDDTSRRRISGDIEHVGTVDWSARLWSRHRETELLRTLLLAPGLGDRVLRDLDGDGWGGAVEAGGDWYWTGRPARTSGGVEGSAEDHNTVYRAVGADGALGVPVARATGERRRLGVFVSQDLHLSDTFRMVAGVRWDEVEDDLRGGAAVRGSATSPRVGVNWRLASWVLHGRWSRAFKAATVDQLFDPRPFPDLAGGTFVISSPDVRPQRAESVEVGVARRPAGGLSGPWLDVTAYRTAVDDEIDFDPATFRLANIGRTLHRGVEASARWRPGSRVSPTATYAWTRVSLRDDPPGRQLKNIPEHRLRLGARAALPLSLTLHATADARFGTWTADDANRFPLSDVVLLDLRLSRPVGGERGDLYLDLLNATDEDWEQVGLVLTGFDGVDVPLVFPGPGLRWRVGGRWEW
jgi:outer membrane receptor protein involved in Fe transport